jgi:dipeptidyl aminopeptidase/acylaminoacyl peptidase
MDLWMNLTLRSFINPFLFLLCLIADSAHASLSLDDYGSLPSIGMVAISPNGHLLAFRKVTNGQDAVYIVSIKEKKTVFALDVSAIQPESIYFFNDEQVFLRASKFTRVAGFNGKFDLSTAFVLNIKDKKIRQLLIPGDKILAGQTGLGNVVGITPDGQYALMPAYSQVDNHFPKPVYSLYKVSLNRKHIRSAQGGDFNTEDFFVDRDGKAIAQEEYDEKNNEHKILALHDGKWVEIFKEITAIKYKSFVGVTADFKSLVMLASDGDTGRTSYYTMSLADGVITGPLLGRDDADIESVVTDLQRVVYGVRYSGFTPSYKFFDPATDKKMNAIMAEFPDQSVWLIDWTPDWKNLVVNVEGSDYPDDYFLFDAENNSQYLTSGRPQFKPEDIHPIGKVTYAARDGLKIPTLITIPRSKVDAIKNLPAVIYPHGGPAAYDTVGFDYQAQALAAQGYVVIQPQFRGSDGFGAAHYTAGLGEWGKKMQDDLTDAVRFFTSKGMVDPKRICIIGASYGGYAALAGGAFTPDLYKCVVSINGIGDLNDMLAWDKGQNGSKSEVADYMAMQFAKGEVDKKELEKMSPEKHASQFSAPVLLIHSVNDQRVPIKQSEQMLKALKKQNKPAELIELEGDNHHLLQGSTRKQALDATIKFVNQHLQ